MVKKAPIISYKEVSSLKKITSGRKTVLVGGCFDLIHYGHLRFLKKARQCGDFLVVALESDEFVSKYKRKIPVHFQNERAEILAEIKPVDAVVKLPLLNSYSDYLKMVRKISPQIIAVTEGDSQIENKKKQAEAIGAKVVKVTPLLKKYSTRKIINEFI